MAGKMKERGKVPIVNRGDGNKVEDYRGVTLLPTLYKVYVAVLTERSGSLKGLLKGKSGRSVERKIWRKEE